MSEKTDKAHRSVVHRAVFGFYNPGYLGSPHLLRPLYPTALQCPAHSYFTTCLPSCPASCSNLDGSCVESNFKAPFICKEGCICQPGYFLNNDKCVLRIQCGCKDAQGGLIPVSGRGKWDWWVAEEMAYWVKCLPCKCEHLSLNLKLRRLDMGASSFYLETRESLD